MKRSDRRSTRIRRASPAFTLIEVVVAIALTAIVASALMSGFLLSLRTIPSPDDPGLAAYEIDRAFEHLLTDASLASEVATENGRLSLLVPDQTGDDAPDLVVYSLEDDQAAETALLRTINGGDPVRLVSRLASCSFTLRTDAGTATSLTVQLKAESGRIHRAGFELVTRPYAR